MPDLIVEGSDQPIPLNPAVSILNHLLKSGVPIRHDCGGKALCGTCRIEILEGKKFLSPMKENERARLAAVHAGPDFRLACQTYACAGVRVRVPEPDSGA